MNCKLFKCWVIVLCLGQPVVGQQWKAGVARTVITPQEKCWQAGYAMRDKPADGVLHDLWAKALVLDDGANNRLLIVTMDILGMPKDVSDELRNGFEKKYGLTRSQIVFSASHTHSGPVLSRGLFTIYPMSEAEWKKIDHYTLFFKKKILDVVDEAMKATAPAKVSSQSGMTRFQVNRRQNKESALKPTDTPLGPNDYSVPVIKITDLKDNLKAILFGYACHATTLSLYQYSGDYPGFAQIELEKRYPGVQAMFFQGACADTNPMPRRSIGYARQYGEELAAAVTQVLSDSMNLQNPALKSSYAEIRLPFDTHPSKEELETVVKSDPNHFFARWATYLLDEMKAGHPLETDYNYPIQAIKIGNQPLVTLGGEVVVQYSIHMKRLFGENVFVMAYANDVMAYIPTHRVLREGGYEGDSSMRVYAHPSKWAYGIETKIMECVLNLGKEIGLQGELNNVEFTQ